MGSLPLECSGSNSQPCTSNPSFFHQMLCTRAAKRIPVLTAVRSRQWPMAPTSISGAAVKDSCTAAVIPDGHAAAWPSPVFNNSSPLHKTRGTLGSRPDPRSTNCVLSPASNCACSRPPQSQNNDVAEAGIAGVTFVTEPPSSGSVYTSPPVEPKSLMIPAMKATVAPSRDTLGIAICCRSAGVYSTLGRGCDAEKAYSLAFHQLSSPLPGAAVPTNPLPSGRQSYS